MPMWFLKERNLDMSDEWKYKYIFNSPVNVSSFGGSISRIWSFFDILSANYHLVTWLVSLLAVSSVELSETELRFKHSTRQMLLRRTSTKLLIGILFEQPWQRLVFAFSLKAKICHCHGCHDMSRTIRDMVSATATVQTARPPCVWRWWSDELARLAQPGAAVSWT